MDLNADLAEGEIVGPTDLAVLDVVTSASLACGFHAGNPSVMREAAEACVERGVAIGAHVSYRDRAGFGRRVLHVEPEQLAADLVEQWEALVDAVDGAGGRVRYVKPHGALYHAVATDTAVAGTLVDALGSRCPVLVGPPGGMLAAPAAAAGVRVVTEGFCDRGYDRRGVLDPPRRGRCLGRRHRHLSCPGAVAGRRRRHRRGGRHAGWRSRSGPCASTATGPMPSSAPGPSGSPGGRRRRARWPSPSGAGLIRDRTSP